MTIEKSLVQVKVPASAVMLPPQPSGDVSLMGGAVQTRVTELCRNGQMLSLDWSFYDVGTQWQLLFKKMMQELIFKP